MRQRHAKAKVQQKYVPGKNDAMPAQDKLILAADAQGRSTIASKFDQGVGRICYAKQLLVGREDVVKIRGAG